jgi:hypothetical protein
VSGLPRLSGSVSLNAFPFGTNRRLEHHRRGLLANVRREQARILPPLDIPHASEPDTQLRLKEKENEHQFPDRLCSDRDIVARVVCILLRLNANPLCQKKAREIAPSVPAPIVEAPFVNSPKPIPHPSPEFVPMMIVHSQSSRCLCWSKP